MRNTNADEISKSEDLSASEDTAPLAPRVRTMFYILLVGLCSIGFWPLFDPMYQAASQLQYSVLRHSLDTGYLFAGSSLVLLGLLLPLVTDWVLDAVGAVADRWYPLDSRHRRRRRRLRSGAEDKPLLLLHEKLLVNGGFAATPLIAFLPSTFGCDPALFFFCLTRFQLVAVYGTVWVSLCRLDTSVWPPWTVAVGLLLWTLGLHLTMIAAMGLSINPALPYVAAAFKYTAIYGFFVAPSLLFMFRGIFHNLFTLTVSAFLYTLMCTTSFIIAIVIMTAVGSYDNLSDAGLLAYNCAFIFLALGLVLFSMRREKTVSAFKEAFEHVLMEVEEERERVRNAALTSNTPGSERMEVDEEEYEGDDGDDDQQQNDHQHREHDEEKGGAGRGAAAAGSAESKGGDAGHTTNRPRTQSDTTADRAVFRATDIVRQYTAAKAHAVAQTAGGRGPRASSMSHWDVESSMTSRSRGTGKAPSVHRFVFRLAGGSSPTRQNLQHTPTHQPPAA
jgi:hypothetical protein